MTYSTAIRSCGKGSAWHISMELFQEALLWRVEADAMAVNVLITALGRGDQWPRALQMLAAGNTDVIAYNVARAILSHNKPIAQIEKAVGSKCFCMFLMSTAVSAPLQLSTNFQLEALSVWCTYRRGFDDLMHDCWNCARCEEAA